MTDNPDNIEKQLEEPNQKVQVAKAKGQYWWGFLGLIPLLGAFIGIVLLLLGIFRYKDKILVYIGTACILFTVGIYTFLFYNLIEMTMYI